jgi:hypothetical protein
MKKTYKEFLDNFNMYAEGAELEASFYDYRDNEELYRRAINEGYIMFGIDSKGYPRITVLRHPVPYLSHEDVISYFN